MIAQFFLIEFIPEAIDDRGKAIWTDQVGNVVRQLNRCCARIELRKTKLPNAFNSLLEAKNRQSLVIRSHSVFFPEDEASLESVARELGYSPTVGSENGRVWMES